MKIAFDIGGVISKYPEFRQLMIMLYDSEYDPPQIYVITDMHDKEYVITTLKMNDIPINIDNIYVADYAQYGEMCKAVLLKQLNIDIFIDDYAGYLQWDSRLGKAPIRLLVQPDPFAPYWHHDWKTPDNLDFGRRVCPQELL